MSTRVKMTGKLLVLASLAVGCGDVAQPVDELGIARVEVTESANSLSIVGLDVSGAQIASIKLTTGPFVMEEDGRAVDGRQMSVDVRGVVFKHESAGYNGLQLPNPKGEAAAEVNVFLHSPQVEPVLTKWGVGLAQPPSADQELAYSMYYLWADFYEDCVGCNYSGCASSSTSSCGAVNRSGDQEEIRCCSNNTFANRWCAYPGASTPCGEAGGAGCAVCWTTTTAPYSCLIQSGPDEGGGAYCLGEYY